MSAKVVFAGVAEDHDVPNQRTVTEPGTLVVVVKYGRKHYVLTAPNGNPDALDFANPTAFGYERRGMRKGQAYYTGRRLRRLSNSDFTVSADAETVVDFFIEARPSQSKLKKAAKAITLIGVAAVAVTVVISSEKGKQLAAKASDSLSGLRNR